MGNTLPAPKIETVELSRLKPWDKNPRKNHAVDGIARSIEELGYLSPIIVQSGTYRILAGHGRLDALKRLGILHVPVIVAEISDQKADLYTIADNKLTESASWDQDLLRAIVGELQLKEVDLTVSGFTEGEIKELENLTIDDPAGAEDDLVEPEASAVTQLGDLWELGAHRVVCGDSTHEAPYRRILGPDRADLIFTDPPYGVDYKAKKFDLIKNDELKGQRLLAFLAEALSWATFSSKEDAAFYVWHASSTRHVFSAALAMAGLIERQYLIWVKPSLVLGHADYQWQHEPCFYAAKQDGKPAFYGDRSQATVWQVGTRKEYQLRYQIASGLILSDVHGRQIFITPVIPRSKKLRRIEIGHGQTLALAGDIMTTDCWAVGRDGAAEHPTQKPVELARRAIENSSKPGEIILDPFLGSGSTLIAAEVTGRSCRGIELAPQYVDVIVKRWQLVTGKKGKNLTRPEVTL